MSGTNLCIRNELLKSEHATGHNSFGVKCVLWTLAEDMGWRTYMMLCYVGMVAWLPLFACSSCVFLGKFRFFRGVMLLYWFLFLNEFQTREWDLSMSSSSEQGNFGCLLFDLEYGESIFVPIFNEWQWMWLVKGQVILLLTIFAGRLIKFDWSRVSLVDRSYFWWRCESNFTFSLSKHDSPPFT